MDASIFFRPELARLRWNGHLRAAGKACDFAPVVRLWMPSTPLQWFLTDLDIVDEQWIYGLCVSADDEIELNWWSRDKFETLAAVRGPFRLQSSSRFAIYAPLSSYLRAVTRKKRWGF